MARARNIKPKFFQNDELGELSPLARLLFIGMWTIADFRGCMEFRPKRIKTQLLPYDDCDIESLATSLDKSGFISIYSVQGQRYAKVLKFERHQTPHKNERDAGSEIPDFDKKDIEINELKKDGNNPDKNGTDPAESLFLNPESFNLNPESLTLNAEPINPQPRKRALSEQSTDEPVSPIIERRGVTIENVESEQEVTTAIALTVKPRGDVGDDVRQVFTYWQQVMNHSRAQLDSKRQKAIKARLKDGYSVTDLCLAIDGCSRSAYHMGQNDNRTIFDDIELICRDGPKVDSFIKKASIVPNAVHRTTAQQQTLDNLTAYLQE